MADVVDNQFYEANCYIRGTSLAATYNYCNGEKSGYTYYVQNAHGDVVNLTDADGAVIKSYTYDAFGVEFNPVTGDVNAFRYCGEYFDTETGTIYLRARYYQASTGRFTQRDTVTGKIGDPLSLNLYTYCHNNPVFYFDPSGHKAYGHSSGGHGGGDWHGYPEYDNKFSEIYHVLNIDESLSNCKDEFKDFVSLHRAGMEDIQNKLEDKKGTFGFGASGNLTVFFISYSYSLGYTIDCKGDIEYQQTHSLGLNLYAANIGIAPFASISTAEHARDLEGYGESLGIWNIEYFTSGSDWRNPDDIGLTYSSGKSLGVGIPFHMQENETTAKKNPYTKEKFTANIFDIYYGLSDKILSW